MLDERRGGIMQDADLEFSSGRINFVIAELHESGSMMRIVTKY